VISRGQIEQEELYPHPPERVWRALTEVTAIKEGTEVEWLCVSGHEPWQDGQFRFQIAEAKGGHTRLRCWQEYGIELASDYYGVYNFNGVTTWRACGSCA
jgi:hypothetical protein